MREANKPLRIYMILGETSGDALGAQLLTEFQDKGIEIQFGGLAGPKMKELGVESLFDISETSVMGFVDVLPQLPNIYRRIRQVTRDALNFDPDILLLIDSPEFTQNIAKRFRKKNSKAKIVKYVCPSVWFWRPGRAKTMTRYIDHILAILPFEPEFLDELGGPETRYVGHPLIKNLERFDITERMPTGNVPNILLLPGSRKSEIKRTLPIIKETLTELGKLGVKANYILPTVSYLNEVVLAETSGWPNKIDVVAQDIEKEIVFKQAHAALACSGTVMLELALFQIPVISIYKLDKIGMIVRHFVSGWTANLPNLIADQVIIPELINEYAVPKRIARMLSAIAKEGAIRQAQLDGFEKMRHKLLGDGIPNNSPVDLILEISKS